MRLTIEELSKKDVRLNLKERHEPYWVIIREGLHFGYYKGPRKNTWVARHINPATQSYFKKTLGEADFISIVGKKMSIDFDEALRLCLEWGEKKNYKRKRTNLNHSNSEK